MKKFLKLSSGDGFQEIDDALLATIPEERRPVSFDADHPDVAAWMVGVARSTAPARVTAFANMVRERIAGSQHYLQAARWPIQLAAAQAIKAGGGSVFDTAIMAREARLRDLGETVEQLAEKVLANSLIFASVGAAVDGIERATMDKIKAYQGTDPAAFDAILAAAKATALAEFLDIFTPVIGVEAAQAKAAQYFGG
jgi:hypothetical protein